MTADAATPAAPARGAEWMARLRGLGILIPFTILFVVLSLTSEAFFSKANLLKLVSRRLRAGATVEIRVTAPDFIGRATRFKMRADGRQPKKTTAQLAPSRRSDNRR